MGFKKYALLGLVLLIAMGVFVYTLNGEQYSLPFAGVSLTLPVAVWVILPALILYVATIVHLMFYGTIGFTRMRKIQKDSQKFLQNSKNALLGKIVDADYKTDFFKLPGAVLPLLNIDPKRYSDYRVYDDGIQDILDVKRKIDAGDVVDLAPFTLRDDNALILKNNENKLLKDKSYAATLLKKCTDKALCQKAHIALASYATMDEIKKYDVEPTRELFDLLLSRMQASENPLDLPNEAIVDYTKKLQYSKTEYINLAKKLRSKINPDRLMLLFERLSHESADATEAYLYVMFELQMIDNARDFLENSGEDEYAKFKYLLFLKESGKNFDTELFI